MKEISKPRLGILPSAPFTRENEFLRDSNAMSRFPKEAKEAQNTGNGLLLTSILVSTHWLPQLWTLVWPRPLSLSSFPSICLPWVISPNPVALLITYVLTMPAFLSPGWPPRWTLELRLWLPTALLGCWISHLMNSKSNFPSSPTNLSLPQSAPFGLIPTPSLQFYSRQKPGSHV